MLKRTKGYILLLLLVLTGLAGRLFTTTITSQERRFLIDNIKDSKAFFLKSVKGLSEKQLNFKTAPNKWSIKECIQHLTLAETDIWNMADAALKQPANSKKRSEIKITDQGLLEIQTNRNKKEIPEIFNSELAKWKTIDEALEAFKDKRASLIKYSKTTTDDMRNHVLEGPLGYMDAYQMLLFLSAHTRLHTIQIEEIKANPAFPK